MKIIKIVNEKYGQNNFLCVEGSDAILIDASANVSQIEENLKMCGEQPKLLAILLTHEHFDHIAELDNLVAKYSCPVFIHKLGKATLYIEKHNLSTLDRPFKIKTKRGIKTFEDEQEIVIGSFKIKCYHLPGHSMGSSAYVIDKTMFVGDTVFKVDIGRNDMFGGDEIVQKISLSRLLNNLSTDINEYYAGHGANFDNDDLKYNLERFLGDN